jgi:hypothetical protein
MDKLEKDLLLFTSDELRDLVYVSTNLSALLDQIVNIKCKMIKSPKDIEKLQKIIDDALEYERPYYDRDPDWGKYYYYLLEIKDSIISPTLELSSSEQVELLSYLKSRAEEDEVVGNFDEDGDWGLGISEIEKAITEIKCAVT